MKTRRALVPGSFDPVTRGHLDIIARASRLFDEVTVCVFHNVAKPNTLFSLDERVALLQAACMSLPGVRVDACDGYVADYAAEHGMCAIVKGVRNEEDLAYEQIQIAFNRRRNPACDTILLSADAALTMVSATEVRRRLEAGKSIEDLVPPETHELLQSFLQH